MEFLSIVRGLQLITIDQARQSLFNPDLVQEALAGDPDGEVQRAGEAINLSKVLDSGPAASVRIVAQMTASTSDIATVRARITDRGKGIGRIEWRVNGVTVGVGAAPGGEGPEYHVTRDLALDPGSNGLIELSELVGHVQSIVPKIAADMAGAGRAAFAATEPVFGKQAARFGSRGEDFAVVNRLHQRQFSRRIFGPGQSRLARTGPPRRAAAP